jgi:hypothetical protein
MENNQQKLVRILNPRERRRMSVYNMIPVDAVDPKCSTRKLIESNTTKLYRYGCSLQDMNLEIEDANLEQPKNEKKNFRFLGFVRINLR